MRRNLFIGIPNDELKECFRCIYLTLMKII